MYDILLLSLIKATKKKLLRKLKQNCKFLLYKTNILESLAYLYAGLTNWLNAL